MARGKHKRAAARRHDEAERGALEQAAAELLAEADRCAAAQAAARDTDELISRLRALEERRDRAVADDVARLAVVIDELEATVVREEALAEQVSVAWEGFCGLAIAADGGDPEAMERMLENLGAAEGAVYTGPPRCRSALLRGARRLRQLAPSRRGAARCSRRAPRRDGAPPPCVPTNGQSLPGRSPVLRIRCGYGWFYPATALVCRTP